MATRPSSFASIGKEVTMLVCKSVAEIVSKLSLISKRKFSRIGKTVLVLEAPLMDCNCLSKMEVETINLMSEFFKLTMCNDKQKILEFWNQKIIIPLWDAVNGF